MVTATLTGTPDELKSFNALKVSQQQTLLQHSIRYTITECHILSHLH